VLNTNYLSDQSHCLWRQSWLIAICEQESVRNISCRGRHIFFAVVKTLQLFATTVSVYQIIVIWLLWLHGNENNPEYVGGWWFWWCCSCDSCCTNFVLMWVVRKGLLWSSERHSCWNVLEQFAQHVPTSADILTSIRDMSHVKYVSLVVTHLMWMELLLLSCIGVNRHLINFWGARYRASAVLYKVMLHLNGY